MVSDDVRNESQVNLDSIRAFIQTFNQEYALKHETFENQFWGNRMALSSSNKSDNGNDSIIYSSELLVKSKQELQDFLSNIEVLNDATLFLNQIESYGEHELKDKHDEDDAEAKVMDTSTMIKILKIIIRTCKCYTFTNLECKQVKEETTKLESQLETKRAQMKLGYTTTTTTTNSDAANDGDSQQQQQEGCKKVFHEASSVELRNIMKTNSNELTRKSAYESLRTIGDFICDNGFLEIVKLRNKLAKMSGYQDYYDYTVSAAEGFGKDQLFSILDDLEKETRPLVLKAREELIKRHGETSLQPWNTGYMMSGSVIEKMDPYFPFSKSVERYIRTYAALGIQYHNSTMTLDLLDRKNKYSNGFCHWPVPAWIRPQDGKFIPSKANFTSLANPSSIGSGITALTTLMHEAGHAAHFANIMQPSPLFSQERAPTSVAYAENQSMFLDSLVSDSAWRAKYARTVEGVPCPFEILEEEIRATHPFKVFQLRGMLAVSYFEKALYELKDEEVTKEKILELADEIEIKIQGGLSPRPMLSVPHIVSDEASCYYQGYTLAEMSVHQTRKYFLDKYGFIVDNPNVGPTLSSAYWKCGNSLPFLQIVKDLTGSELSGSAWINELKKDVEEVIQDEKKDYEDMILKCNDGKDPSNDEGDVDLGMVVKFVDGDLLISDSSTANGGLLGACKEFETFVTSRVISSKS